MRIILLESIKNLGNTGDLIKVSPGYGRNYLIPKKKALFATQENIRIFEKNKFEIEQKSKQEFIKLEKTFTKLNNINLTIKVLSSNYGKLYGSIGPKEITIFLKDNENIEIEKNLIIMPKSPINKIGKYMIKIQLHESLIANVQLDIVKK